jgi:hypothetical protein
MDPNPFKHPAIILAKIRDGVESSLSDAGFQFDGRNKPTRPVHLYLDYSRGNELFRLAWDRRDSNQFIGIVAELIREPDELISVVSTELSYTAKLPPNAATAQIQLQIETITTTINEYLKERYKGGLASRHPPA